MNNNHKKVRLIIRIIGVLILLTGITFTIIGAVSFFKSFKNIEAPDHFWCLMLGLPLMGIGSGLTLFGFSGNIQTYAAKEAAPAVTLFTVAAKDGLSPAPKVCAHCQTSNATDDKFCKSCGKPLAKVCPACNNVQDADAKFCADCGKEL